MSFYHHDRSVLFIPQAEIERLRNDSGLTRSQPLFSQSILNEKEDTINQLTREVSELRDQVSRLERSDVSTTTQDEQVSYSFVISVTGTLNMLIYFSMILKLKWLG